MNNNYFLAVEKQNNSYTLINTADLETSNGQNFQSLEYLDKFTSSYTLETLAALIIKANLVSNVDIEDIIEKIWVITSEKVKNKNKYRKLPVLSKEMSAYNIFDYLTYSLNDKDKGNIIYNYLIKFTNNDLDLNQTLKKAINNRDLNTLYNFINNLDYLNKRRIYFYIINQLIMKDMKYQNIKAKKLNRVA